MRKIIDIDKNILIDLYLKKEMTIKEISQELGCSVGKVFNSIKKYEIETRPRITQRTKERISNSTKGRPSYWLGKKRSDEAKEKMSISKSNGIGKKTISNNGYVRIYFPDHPKSDHWGRISEHDLIMECLIGRWLKDDEVVHHKNGIRTDNRKENLVLMTRSEHTRLHRLIEKGVKTYQ